MAEKTLSIKLSLNDKQFQSALRKSTKSIQRFGNKMQSFGDTMSRNITLPVLGLGAAAVKLASDLEETRDKFNIVFRDIKVAANSAAKELADSFNMTNNESMRLLANTGDLLAGFGFTQQEALSLATQVNKLAADLSSFEGNQFSAAEASKVLTKALLGERDALIGLNIKIAEEDLKSYAEQKGLNVKELDRITKAQLTFELALKQSANAVGNIEKTSGSLSNQLVRVRKDLEDVAAEFGVQLIPLAKSLASGLSNLTKFLSKFSDEQKEGALQAAGFAAVLGPIISIAGRLVKAFASLRKFFINKFLPAMRLVASVLMNLTPQGRIVSGLILAASYLVTNWGKVKKGFDDLRDSILGVKKAKDELDTSLDFGIQGDTPDPSQLQANLMNAIQSGVLGHKPKPVKTKPTERTPDANFSFNFIEPIKATNVELKKLKELTPVLEEFEEGLSSMDIVANDINQSFMSFGNVIQGVFAQALQSQEGFFKSFLEGAKRALAALAAQIASMLILNALLGSFGIGNLLGFQNIGGIKGIGDVLGGVGNVNANSVGGGVGLKSMINTGGSTEVFGTISGADILLSSDRARNNRNRTRGY